MAGQTKMIIITSDEDIIRQFSFNKTKNTQIIELDNNKQIISTETNNTNITDLAFLAQLSELNSSDQIYKRALHSTDHNESKHVKVPRKSMDMICTICGDHAIGFNYDVLSCASCKAFFRRNANQHPEKIRCLRGRGECSFTHGTRRKCPRCRLDRCFAMGMRKDFILSDEEKQRRKQRLEENRNMTSQRLSTSESTGLPSIPNRSSNSESLSPTSNELDRLLMDLDKVDDNIVLHDGTNLNGIEGIYLETLSIEDWITIQSLQSSFISFFQLQTLQCANIIDLSDRDSALISWSEFANQMALRFIGFFRQIGEFEDLHADDRLVLIKYNLFPLFPICKCYNYKPTNDCCSSAQNEQAEKHRLFLTLCGASDGTHESYMNLVPSLVEITEQDPTLLSLFLVMLLFSKGLSMSEDEPSLKDSLAVNRAQSHYTRILWNYLVNKWGETQASKHFTQLLTITLRIQLGTKNIRDFFRTQYMTSNAVDRIAPLMQSVLHIS